MKTLANVDWPRLILVPTGDTTSFEALSSAAALAFGRRGRVLLIDDSLSAWADLVCLTSPPLLWHILGQSEHLMMIPWLKLAAGWHFPTKMCLVSALEVV